MWKIKCKKIKGKTSKLNGGFSKIQDNEDNY